VLKCKTGQYNTIQFNTIQYSSIQYSTVQYNTVQYKNTSHKTTYNTQGKSQYAKLQKIRNILYSIQTQKRVEREVDDNSRDMYRAAKA